MNTSVSVDFLSSAWLDVFIQKLGTYTDNCVLLRKDLDVGLRLG